MIQTYPRAGTGIDPPRRSRGTPPAAVEAHRRSQSVKLGVGTPSVDPWNRKREQGLSVCQRMSVAHRIERLKPRLNTLARNRTWSPTFEASCAVRHTPRALGKQGSRGARIRTRSVRFGIEVLSQEDTPLGGPRPDGESDRRRQGRFRRGRGSARLRGTGPSS